MNRKDEIVDKPGFLYDESIGIIEFQAFRGNGNEYIIKELVFLDLHSRIFHYFLFKSPYSFSKLTKKNARTNLWLTRNYHFISWNEGFVDYKEMDKIFHHYCNQYETIYTTGEDKCKFIGIYKPGKVFNFKSNKENSPQLEVCKSVKNHKHRVSNCALVKAIRLRNEIKLQNYGCE